MCLLVLLVRNVGVFVCLLDRLIDCLFVWFVVYVLV